MRWICDPVLYRKPYNECLNMRKKVLNLHFKLHDPVFDCDYLCALLCPALLCPDLLLLTPPVLYVVVVVVVVDVNK